MTIPKSRVLTISDPLQDLKLDNKDITYIQPLALRGEITTWQYDAKNCIILYYRMLDNNILSKRLFIVIQRWATRLLFYAKELGFTDEYPASICKGKPNILQAYWWLTRELLGIQMQSWGNLGVTCFRINCKTVFLSQTDVKSKCSLSGKPFQKYDDIICYKATVANTIKTSQWCHAKSLDRLIKKLMGSVKKHRNPQYRKKIVEKMRSKKYVDGKLRSGYRKA